MIPYLLTFALSSGLFELGSVFERTRNGRRVAGLLQALAVIALCVLAGARDVTIGTDTAGYGVFIFQQGVLSNSYDSFVTALDLSQWDVAPLFALGSYAVIKVFESQFIYFFVIELAMLVPVVLVARSVSRAHLGLTMLAYMLVFFIPGLNMMRQSIAMGFVMLGTLSLMGSYYVRAGVQLLVACLIHASAVVGFGFYLLWFLLFKKDGNGLGLTYRKWFQPIALLVVLYITIGTIFFRQLTSSLTNLEGVGRLFLYAAHEEGSEYGTSSLLFLCLMIAGVFMLRTGIKGESNIRVTFFCILIALSLPFFVLSGIDNTIARMMGYCTLFIVPLIGTCVKDLRSTTLTTFSGIAMLAASCCVRFFVCFAWQGFNAAIPYTSSMLGIG